MLNFMHKTYQTIYDVPFDDEKTYNAVKNIVEEMEDKFGDEFKKDIILDLKEIIQALPFYMEDFCVGEFMGLMYEQIKNARNFSDIQVPYEDILEEIIGINENIANDYM